MKRKWIALVILCCFVCSGCGSLGNNSYISVTPHQEQPVESNTGNVTASDYFELAEALKTFVESGTEEGVISVPNYDKNVLETHLTEIIQNVTGNNPIGAYAVEWISYELGTNSGQAAIALNIRYIHDRAELRRIEQVKDMMQAQELIKEALNECNTGVVMRITGYQQMDFTQFVEDYVDTYPELVMERPEVSVNVYPDNGQDDQVVELKFTYQTSRETLRNMQTQVKRVFDSAVLYVSGDAEEREKFSQLYSFLMERYDYQIETSITPSYSLLRHGVGDCKTFAVVYAAMCRLSGLECLVVSGTRAGEAWYWNIVHDGERYFHVDLLRSAEAGDFAELTDSEMEGYVWDYSRFPECPADPPEDPQLPDTTEENGLEETTETVPEETTDPSIPPDSTGPEKIQ